MLCLDTYALVEIAKANPKFTKFNQENFIVTDETLAEFYSVILREYDEKTAEYWFRLMSPHSQSMPEELLKEAIKFRHNNRAKNFSFFDAAGYIFARAKGHKFLTGDKEFEGLDGVLFVKKD